MTTETYLYGIPLGELPSYRKTPPVGTTPTVRHEGVNYKLLDEILEYITTHPRQWVQSSWFKVVDTETGASKTISRLETVEEVNSCGTSFCFAGHVALREGFPSPPLNNQLAWDRKVDGREYPEEVQEFAEARLGLQYDQADQLFDADNGLETLRAMALALHLNPNVKGYDLEELRYVSAEGKMKLLVDIAKNAS